MSDKEPESITVSTRLKMVAVVELDRMAEAIRPKPSRSQMVALAVSEFIERSKKKRDR